MFPRRPSEIRDSFKAERTLVGSFESSFSVILPYPVDELAEDAKYDEPDNQLDNYLIICIII